MVQVKNKSLKEFLENLTLSHLRKIARNLNIDGNNKMSKDLLIRAINNQIPKNSCFDLDIPEDLCEFLVNLPKDVKNMLRKIFDPPEGFDFGVLDINDLAKEFDMNQNVLSKKLKSLEEHGLLFRNGKYIAVPEDISFGLANFISGNNPPERITFGNFLLKYLPLRTLKHIAKIYNLKISGTKKELVYRIINTGLSPKDILSVMYYSDLLKIATNLNIFVCSSKSEKEYSRDEVIEKLTGYITYETKKLPKKDIRKTPLNIYDLLIKVISKKFKPILKWNSTESDIEKQLFAYLSGLFEGYNIPTELTYEYKLHSGGKIDLYEKNNDIGIELKYNPSRAYLREAVQRTKEYAEDINKIIVVIFYESFHYSNIDFIKKYESLLREIPHVNVIVRELK